MGAVVFDNQVFDSWLNSKSQEILSKVDRERITTEEMLILILKAQTNHFYHMDLEFREEFKDIRSEFKDIRNEMKDIRSEMHGEISSLRKEMLSGFKWMAGIMIPLFLGLYLKLFLG